MRRYRVHCDNSIIPSTSTTLSVKLKIYSVKLQQCIRVWQGPFAIYWYCTFYLPRLHSYTSTSYFEKSHHLLLDLISIINTLPGNDAYIFFLTSCTTLLILNVKLIYLTLYIISAVQSNLTFLMENSINEYPVSLNFQNILLDNKINSIHPLLLHITVSSFKGYSLIILRLFYLPKCVYMTSLYIYLLNKYLIYVYFAVILYTLILGMYWANQLDSWGGWWVWDYSEILLLLLTMFLLHTLHLSTTVRVIINVAQTQLLLVLTLVALEWVTLKLNTSLHTFFRQSTGTNEAILVITKLWIFIKLVKSELELIYKQKLISYPVNLKYKYYKTLVLFICINNCSYLYSLLVALLVYTLILLYLTILTKLDLNYSNLWHCICSSWLITLLTLFLLANYEVKLNVIITTYQYLINTTSYIFNSTNLWYGNYYLELRYKTHIYSRFIYNSWSDGFSFFTLFILKTKLKLNCIVDSLFI